MKIIKSGLMVLLFTFCTLHLSAHALWIETKATGKVGQVQEVKIHYGEYAQNERDVTSKWYSDVKDLTLWLVGPDKQKIKLNTTLGENFAASSFTPLKDGAYTLEISHPAKDLTGTTMYHFLASTVVQVGKGLKNIDEEAITNELKVFPVSGLSHKPNVPLQLKAVLKGKFGSAKSISVFSPSGWTKALITDANGMAEFTPLWPGRYVVEVTDFQNTKGEHQGKAYEAMWQGSTYSFEVK